MESVVWKPVRRFEDRYMVSNDGRVKSLDIYVNCGGGQRLSKGRIKPVRKNNRGYVCVGLCKDNYTHTHLVHRLVAEAFIPNTENKPQVNHIDGDLNNNCADNLEWVTDNENKAHSSIVVGGTQRPKKAVVATERTTGKQFYYSGLREAERALNLDHGSVMKVLRGKCNSHRGYAISYAEGGEMCANVSNFKAE